MLIDWFTVAAQALNFAVLVWLMKRFLYRPILEAIDLREARIAGNIAEAASEKETAQRERERFQEKSGEFDRSQKRRLEAAREEARIAAAKILAEARQNADELAARRDRSRVQESARFNETLMRRTREEVFSIARLTLKELASVELEQALADGFVRRMDAMDSRTREVMAAALKTDPSSATLRSAFALPAEARASLQRAVDLAFSSEVPLRFETAPQRIAGVELSLGSKRISWNISGFLANMESAIREVVDPPASQKALTTGVRGGS